MSEIPEAAPVVVRVPTPLRGLVGGAAELTARGVTVAEALRDLGARHRALLARLLDDQGQLRPFVNLYLGSRDIKTLGGLQATLQPGTILSIIPAVAGGVP